jgi:nitroreductase
MEFKQVVGNRRSVRFFEPWRPVEREKIQRILEAVYRAPRLLETDFVRVVVVYRDELSEEQLESLKTPTTTAQLDMAPVYLFFFADLQEIERAADGRNYAELMERGVLTPSHGWTHERIRDVIAPYLRAIVESEDRAPLRYRVSEAGPVPPTVSRQVLALARNATGIAQAYALLAAVNLGLAVQLSALSARFLDVPETWLPNGCPMFLGYAGESPEAGGQRPRGPFEEDFFELRYGHPFYREQAVVQRLTEAGMFQAPAPLPWRWDELRGLAAKYGLPD